MKDCDHLSSHSDDNSRHLRGEEAAVSQPQPNPPERLRYIALSQQDSDMRVPPFPPKDAPGDRGMPWLKRGWVEPVTLTMRWSWMKRPSLDSVLSGLSFTTLPQGEEATPRNHSSLSVVHNWIRPL